MQTNIDKISWIRTEKSDKKVPISSFSKYKKARPQNLNFLQKEALFNAINLPIEIIRRFHKYTNMSNITNTTPIDIIIQNKHLPWDKDVIVNKMDVRMIHTIHFSENFNLKWNYFNLTKNEPDKCNIAIYPNLPWDIKAIEDLNVDGLCNDHLLFLLNKYKNIKWDWQKATKNLSLNAIILNSSLNWDYNTINYKLLDINNKDIIEISLLSLPTNLIDWDVMTQKVSWDFISKYPNLPWNYKDKNICKCDDKCFNIISLDNLKLLKTKPLNWEKISSIFTWECIYTNQYLPWDEKVLTSAAYPPIWFVRNTKYKWDMKKITHNSKQYWKNILENPDIKWDEEEMIINNDNDFIWDEDEPIINTPPIELLYRYKNLKWDWDKYSEKIKCSDILDYSNLPWNWKIITNRKDISIGFALRFPEKSWLITNFSDILLSDKISLRILIVLKICFNQDIVSIIFNKI